MPTTIATSSLTVRKSLPCSPAVAFRAWTDPSQFPLWFKPHPSMNVSAVMDLRRGGKYQITFVRDASAPKSDQDDAGGCQGSKETMNVGGEFLVIEPPHRLEFTWMWHRDSEPNWVDRTVVKLAFNATGANRCEVVLTHENFSDPASCKSHTEGWTAILESMGRHLKA